MSLHLSLFLESLVNGALDVTAGRRGLVGRASPSHPVSHVRVLRGCWVDHPELTALWFTQG